MYKVRGENSLKDIFLADMAQTVLQVSGLRHDSEHADVQGFQQTAILRGVSSTEFLTLYCDMMHDPIFSKQNND